VLPAGQQYGRDVHQVSRNRWRPGRGAAVQRERDFQVVQCPVEIAQRVLHHPEVVMDGRRSG